MEKKNEFMKEVLIGAVSALFAFGAVYLACVICYFIEHEVL